MEKEFKNISVKQLQDNPFQLIGDEWMLITAGSGKNFNTMTASWGGLGILWHKAVAICFVRPQRHTHQFMESNDTFSLCFFEKKYRNILQYCGSHSGSEVDKIGETGLTPILTEDGTVYFEQARLVLECKKLYADRLKEDHFLIPEVAARNYPRKDYHTFYIGEIVSCLLAQ